MNILLLGSGGREHALTWKITQSPKCGKLFVAPGNAGTAQLAENIPIDLLDFPALAAFCKSNSVELIIVGPEAPLVAGISDYFKNNTEVKHIPVIGPDKKGAQLEGSKDFSKNFMLKYGIPTAASKTFIEKTLQEGLKYLESHSLPIVLKADGLAAGKGVIISESLEEAKEVLQDMLANKRFGEASAKVVVEQFLRGIELSMFVLTDGISYTILPEAKDYKRIGDGDTGLNTGGMGAVSPVPFADKAFIDKVEEKIIKPTIQGLRSEKIDYVGFIFIGLMNVGGEPFVIEYNARLGDPETEVIIPRIESDLLELFIATGKKELSKVKIELSKKTAATVMLVAGGYPGEYEKGKEISGLENTSEALPFHAGTKLANGKILTNGGRVISVTALGDTIPEAIKKCYKAADQISYQDKYFRKDIGMDLLSVLL